MAQVTDTMQATLLDLILEATKTHHEVALAQLMSSEVAGASHDLLMALHAAYNGSESAVATACYNIGLLVILVPSRAIDYRKMMTDLSDAI